MTLCQLHAIIISRRYEQMTEGERIKQIRTNAQMTQTEFAKKIGVSQPAIAKIENNGVNNVTEQMRRSICREFNIDPIWLATGDGEPTIDQSVELITILDKLLHNESDLHSIHLKTGKTLNALPTKLLNT